MENVETKKTLIVTGPIYASRYRAYQRYQFFKSLMNSNRRKVERENELARLQKLTQTARITKELFANVLASSYPLSHNTDTKKQLLQSLRDYFEAQKPLVPLTQLYLGLIGIMTNNERRYWMPRVYPITTD